VLLGLAGQLLRRPGVLLLDEPTNNLDLAARGRLYEAVDGWGGVLVVVSHDRELLRRVDRIAELRGGEVRWYGGNVDDYEAAVAAEQETAERMVRVAEADLRRQRRELADVRTTLDHRRRYGQKMYDTKREPRAVMRQRKRQAQVSAGKLQNGQLARVEEARERLAEAEQSVRDDEVIRVDLPGTAVPAGRTVLQAFGVELHNGTAVDLEIRGPERIALVGRNGAGKTTLLRTLAGELAPREGEVLPAVPVRHLPQRLDLLDDELTVAQNAARFAPEADVNTIRARLARFLFRGGRADLPAGSLSGGERLRAALAALLLAEPAPQLLLLDEPTNNLDLAGVRQLARALESYRGALLIAAHDLTFLREVGVTRWLVIEDGVLRETGPSAEPGRGPAVRGGSGPR
jgi:ATPase subunit of ABC transporter with duplicated ATPase domains